MKVIYVGGQCKFCSSFPRTNHHRDNLVEQRAYTVTHQQKIATPWGRGVGYLLAEVAIKEGWYWCSCAFREVKGDDEAWQRLMEKNTPKVKELEPV